MSMPEYRAALPPGTPAHRHALLVPCLVTLAASVALSLLALYFSPVMVRDGMFYIHVAELFQQGGLSAARAEFDWPFFSVLLATLDSWLPWSMGVIGYGISIVFAALTTWMLVLILFRVAGHRRIGVAMFIALAFGPLNQYRSDVLRDWPNWFFILLAVWSFLRFRDKGRWGWAITFLLAVVAAALFRLEALLIVVPLSLVMLLERDRSLADKIRFVAIPGVLMLALFGMLLANVGGFGHRAWQYLNNLNAVAFGGHLEQASDRLAEAVLNQFSDDYAMLVLVVGVLAILPVKIIHWLWLLMLPRLLELRQGVRAEAGETRAFVWLAVAWGLMLMVFLLQAFFVSSRYIVPMMLFMLPPLYLALLRLPATRWRQLLLALILLQGASEAISTKGYQKRIFIDAGRWVSEHIPRQDAVHIDDGRVSYYAGASYFPPGEAPTTASSEPEWQVLHTRKRNAAHIEKRLAPLYHPIRRFDSGGNEIVVIFKKGGE